MLSHWCAERRTILHRRANPKSGVSLIVEVGNAGGAEGNVRRSGLHQMYTNDPLCLSSRAPPSYDIGSHRLYLLDHSSTACKTYYPEHGSRLNKDMQGQVFPVAVLRRD